MTDDKNNSSNGDGINNASSPLAGCPVPADPELIAEGWELRFFGDSRMAQDAVDTYGSLNFDVRLEAINMDNMRDECSGCAAMFAQFCVVYTRKKEDVTS